MSSIFEPFQAAATAAAREVWPALSPTLRGLLEDAAGGSAKGQDALGTHLLESIAAEQALASAGIQPPALEGPGALARARFGAQREVQAALADAPPLDTEQHASELAEELFAETFSIRAQKRRGGVYTRRALVDTLLDLSGWGEAEGPQTLWEPAVGAGAFLTRAWERAFLAGRSPGDLATDLVGTDVHPFACHAARVALAILASRLGVDPSLAPRVVCCDALGPLEAGALGVHSEWDLVLGNPPWVRGERIPKALRAAYRERYAEVGPGNSDLASYFVAAALSRLSPRGRLAFVVSQGVLDAGASAGVRALLTPGLEAIAELEWAPPAFPGANVIPALLVASRAPSEGPLRLGAALPDSSLALDWAEVPRDRWGALSQTRWAIHVRDPDLELLEVLSEAPRPLQARYGLAVRTRVGATQLVAEGEEPPASFAEARPLRDGRDVVAWGATPVRRWIDYRPEAISDPKKEGFFAGPKVLVPRIALTPQAWVDESDALCRNTLMVVTGPLPPHALAAVINSLPLRYFAYHLLRAGVLASSHRCTIYSGVIGDFPVPAAALEAGALREQLEASGRECAQLAAAGDPRLVEAEEALDTVLGLAYGLSPIHMLLLRARAGAAPLAQVLCPTRLGDRRRSPGVQAYAPGERYA